MRLDSPKIRLLKNESLREAHSSVVSTLAFEMAADLAMIQMLHNLPSGGDNAAANHHRMEGAQMFLSVLMTIGDNSEIKKINPQGLDYKA